ncbi:MAG: TolC family protein [Aquabacterium sp.]|uniref:TolC family protein n=1 Tax=Aquabacterium sp. TaxID=1872578 RepID=UPI0025BA5329|nr:TolC family protein [Aquabacterium sp.]MBI3381958.1 TolC family protein [Aquabacterium sp.]
MSQSTLIKTALCLAVAVLAAQGSAWARCGDDVAGDGKADKAASRTAKAAAAAAPAEAEPMDPMKQLQLIAREASRRSAAFGASRLLAEAAALDVTEVKAGRWPQVSVSGNLGTGGSKQDSTTVTSGNQSSVSLNVSAPLWDNGRISHLTDWRSQLAGSAKFGAAITGEQVVLEAVSAALERNRYRLQAQVYQQYMRKMSCLVEALEGIVAEDKGRTSELVQARKTQAQTELQRDQALAQSRQIEIKLRKLIGDTPPPGDGITLPLATVPEIGEINRQIEMGNDAQQLRAQADAADSYSKAVVAGQRPQFNWSVGKSSGVQGSSQVSAWHAGVTVSYSLFNGFSDDAVSQAAVKRAEAARQQLADLLNTKFSRTAETYDVAATSFERAKRYVDVLRDSERVRNFTFQQWSQLGRRSLFDVMSAESDHFNLRIAYVNALHDGYMASAQLRSLGSGLTAWLIPDQMPQ